MKLIDLEQLYTNHYNPVSLLILDLQKQCFAMFISVPRLVACGSDRSKVLLWSAIQSESQPIKQSKKI